MHTDLVGFLDRYHDAASNEQRRDIFNVVAAWKSRSGRVFPGVPKC
jgi:hypothetical protein